MGFRSEEATLKVTMGWLDILTRTVLWLVLGPVLFAVLVPSALLASRWQLLSYGIGSLRFIGIMPICLGAAVVLWCAWDFMVVGRGTPLLFDPPPRLVSRGLYRVVRNPMYIGVELILGGEAIAFESLILLAYAVGVWVMFHGIIIAFEEPYLRKTFGAAYEEYSKAVPRWVPRWKRAEG
ncbi:MAG: isoprenylcysteine carboxylmethyltransferase family protein [Candidatus Rokubacteria bacterium]|nr:isoprenylcysteine carboxylmethyltransferase family protein [Candidatus Rokubacteria bacterium]